jgi:alkylation response protein AidB-like acyl-CoA dehydrogenase
MERTGISSEPLAQASRRQLLDLYHGTAPTEAEARTCAGRFAATEFMHQQGDAVTPSTDTPWQDIRDGVKKVCEGFPNAYWVELERAGAYPAEFVAALTQAGYLAALIPEDYGGAGLPLSAGCAILETSRAATPPPATRRCT